MLVQAIAQKASSLRVLSVSLESSHSFLVSFCNRGDALYVLPDSQEVMMQLCHDMNYLLSIPVQFWCILKK